jgi:hypothetical protein
MDELTNPSPVEISVDDINNPSIAYTAASNIYNLYGQNSGSGGKLYTNGETVKLGMKNNSNKPLFGAATGTSTVKGDGTAIVTNNIGQQYWWTLTQTATTITNPQDAQYGVMCSNNTAPFVLKENAGNPQWGFFTTGSVGPIRLIPASDISFTAASVVEWGQHSAIVEANPTAASGIDATSVVAHLNGAESSAIELFETKSSVKGGATKYNYTVNFGDAIDFAAAASNGAMLTLERVSPLLVLLPALVHGIGYLRGPSVRSRMHSSIAANNRKRARREKKQRELRLKPKQEHLN